MSEMRHPNEPVLCFRAVSGVVLPNVEYAVLLDEATVLGAHHRYALQMQVERQVRAFADVAA